jgi:hypothetical protein
METGARSRQPGVFLCGAPMSGNGGVESSSLAPPHYICFVSCFLGRAAALLTSTPACESVRYDNTHTPTNTSQKISYMDPVFEILSFAQRAKTCPFGNQAGWLVKRISTTGDHTHARDRDRKRHDAQNNGFLVLGNTLSSQPIQKHTTEIQKLNRINPPSTISNPLYLEQTKVPPSREISWSSNNSQRLLLLVTYAADASLPGPSWPGPGKLASISSVCVVPSLYVRPQMYPRGRLLIVGQTPTTTNTHTGDKPDSAPSVSPNSVFLVCSQTWRYIATAPCWNETN